MPQVLDWQVGDRYLTDNGRTAEIVEVSADKLIGRGILGEVAEFDLAGYVKNADACKLGNLQSRLTGSVR